MNKGSRRKARRRPNRAKRQRFIVPEGIGIRKLRKNPPWGPLDQKALRKLANQIIGQSLMNALDIDFVGIMESREKEQRDKPITETIQ